MGISNLFSFAISEQCFILMGIPPWTVLGILLYKNFPYIITHFISVWTLFPQYRTLFVSWSVKHYSNNIHACIYALARLQFLQDFERVMKFRRNIVPYSDALIAHETVFSTALIFAFIHFLHGFVQHLSYFFAVFKLPMSCSVLLTIRDISRFAFPSSLTLVSLPATYRRLLGTFTYRIYSFCTCFLAQILNGEELSKVTLHWSNGFGYFWFWVPASLISIPPSIWKVAL